MTVYVVYKRNKENQSDTMVSYSTDRATAEQLIPPNLEKDFYIQEMPKLDIAKPVYSSGLWTRSDAEAFKENNDYIKKSVVTNPMLHRTSFPTELPVPVVNYIKGYEDKTRQDNEDIKLFDSETNLNAIDINIKITKVKPYSTTQTKKQPIQKQEAEPATKQLVSNSKSYDITSYNQSLKDTYGIKKEDNIVISSVKPKKTNIDYLKYVKKETTKAPQEDGKNVFRYSFRYCYPNMKPELYKSLDNFHEDSSDVKFMPGNVYPDRDFNLIVYTTSTAKAEKIVKQHLKHLIDIKEIRPC